MIKTIDRKLHPRLSSSCRACTYRTEFLSRPGLMNVVVERGLDIIRLSDFFVHYLERVGAIQELEEQQV